MFTGRVCKHVKDVQFRISGTFSGSGSYTPPEAYPAYKAWITSLTITDAFTASVGTQIEIDANSNLTSTSVTFTWGENSYTWTDASYNDTTSAELHYRNVRIYVDGYPTFRVVYDAVNLIVNGTVVYTADGDTASGAGLAPGYMPFFGIPPYLSGQAYSAGGTGGAADTYSALLQCVAEGGYRILDQTDTPYAFPVNFDPVTVPAGTYGCTAGTISVTDSWTASCTVSEELWPVSGVGYHQFRFAFVYLFPGIPQGVRKMISDYEAMVLRLDLPGFASTRSSKWRDFDAGETHVMTDETSWDLPKTDSVLAVVGDAAHVIEGPFNDYTPSCPYSMVGRLGIGTSLGDNVGANWPGDMEWPTHLSYLTFNYGFSVFTERYTTMVANLYSTWFNLGWSYMLWFPRDGLSSESPNAWLVDGGTADPTTYWLNRRHQEARHGALPEGENTQNQLQIVTEPLNLNGLAGFMDSVAFGQVTSWWGISRFQPLPMTRPNSVALEIHDLWSVEVPDGGTAPLSLSFDAGGVTISPVDSRTSGRVRLALWGQDGLGWYNACADTVHLSDPTITGDGAIAPVWAAFPNLRVPITYAGTGDYAKPTAENARYMGSWPEDWGQDLIFGDVGADSLANGVSVPAYGAGLVNELAQPLGTNRQYLRLEFEVSGLTAGSTIYVPWPVLKASSGARAIIADQAQRQVVAHADGPAYRWGCQNYWDPGLGIILDWPSQQPQTLAPSALDAIGFRQTLNGIAATSGLDAIVGSFYDYGVEYTQDKHLVSDPFAGAQLTHGFLLPIGSGGKLSSALVNSYSEVPPLCALPNPKRDTDTYAADPALGFENKTWSWAQGRRYCAEPDGETASTVTDAGGTSAGEQEEPDVSGWRFWSYKLASPTNAEAGYRLKFGTRRVMSFRPWWGLWWTKFVPLSESGACGYDVSSSLGHVRTFVRSGDANFTIGRSANLIAWHDRDSGIAATWARPRFTDVGEEWIGVLYGDGSTVRWARTRDFGATWADDTDLGDGTMGDFDEGANSLKWMFKVLSSDGGSTYDVWSMILDSQLNVVRDWTITNLVGVDNAPIAAREGIGPDRRWRIGVLHFAGGDPAVKFSHDGLTFA